MTSPTPITPYEIEVLTNIIDMFVATGRPVSSRSLKERYRLDSSSANIRRILHKLEEDGYLFKPHVSAGRMPSDRGYRLYVDRIRTVTPLSYRLMEEIRRKIGKDWDDLRDIMGRTSRLLSELTNYMGLIMGIFYSSVIVEGLKIVQLEGAGGLVILHLKSSAIRKVYVDFPKRYPAYLIDRAVQMINERIADRPLEEAPQKLDIFLRNSEGAELEIVGAISAEGEELFDWAYDIKYYFKGIENLSENPELSDLKILRNLVALMGKRGLILKVLKNRLKHEKLVTIGGENDLEELEGLSIVTRRFRTGDCSGLLGILGPTRMAYRSVLSLLSGMAEELQRV